MHLYVRFLIYVQRDEGMTVGVQTEGGPTPQEAYAAATFLAHAVLERDPRGFDDALGSMVDEVRRIHEQHLADERKKQTKGD